MPRPIHGVAFVLLASAFGCHHKPAPGTITGITAWQDPGSFATHIRGRTDPVAGQPADVEITVIRLRGPGEYPLGSAWDRGATRATVLVQDGIRCMTRTGGGTVTMTMVPVDGTLVSGARLEGNFRILCSADAAEGETFQFTGNFAVTMP